MNIQHRMVSPQPMGVPDIRVQDPYPSPFGSDARSRTLPRAIPNAQDAPPPGIPSMEAPASIFGDYRHRLLSLPSVDFPSGTPTDSRKSGSSMKDRWHAFNAMQVDGSLAESSRPSHASYQSVTESPVDFPGRLGRVEGFRPLPGASVASTADSLKSSLSEAMRKTFDAYDKGIVQKLNSPVSSIASNGGPPLHWGNGPSLMHRPEERNGSISSTSSFTPSFTTKDRSPKLPGLSDITHSFPSSPAIPETSSQWSNSASSPFEPARSGFPPFSERGDRSPQHSSSMASDGYERERRNNSFSMSSNYMTTPDRAKSDRLSPESRGFGDDDIAMDDAPPARSSGTPFEYRKSPGPHPSPGPRYAKFRPGPYSPREDRYSESRNRFYSNDSPSDLNRVTMSGGLNFTSQSGPARSSMNSSRTSYNRNENTDPSKSPTPYSRGHQRTISEAVERQQASEAAVGPKHHSAPKLLGVLMCECCPKKPKKFDNQLDLKMHEMEKQYGCKYCTHRFKNKNEAERHQNSLHLRKHSWCCSAIASTPEAAFHPSTAKHNYVDICGYCGDEFPNPPDWQVRHDHLSEVHKFGECNQNKKFFRADHFRQHLKHTHAGTSGKWANVLENACKREVPEHEQHPDPVMHNGMDMMD
ncbi:hypothetical protein AA313_de0208100 [Arthrobotrys entomopaga]|nr:hypothetical protein AA313_de0208100 [Arthrobotrys entomopaga]